MYLERALDILPRPAALFGWPTMDFISWNEAAARLAADQFPNERPPPSVAWAGLSNEEVLTGLSSDGYFLAMTDVGAVTFSLLDPLPTHPRPTLVLSVAHGLNHTEGAARLDDIRLRTTLLVNEAVEVANEVLDLALQNIGGTMSALEAMAKLYNEGVSSAIKETDGKV